MPEEQIKVDVIIVGAGLAGLACAIKLAKKSARERRLSQRASKAIKILVIEKSEQIGGHILSGAVIRLDSLKNLLSNKEYKDIDTDNIVQSESFYALTENHKIKIPFVLPKMRQKGLPIVSMSNLVVELYGIATELGVEIITGQTVDSLVWEGERVVGVKSGTETVYAKNVVIAEGPAGLLTKELTDKFPTLKNKNLQTYGLGIKELFEVPSCPEKNGSVTHTFGYPLGLSIYGGGFIYHIDDTHVALGLVTALDYKTPEINLHQAFRRWKKHPLVQSHIKNGKPIEYGARLVPEGGWYSLLKMSSNGTFLIGDAAGLVDTIELKGAHLAIESGSAVALAIIKGWASVNQNIPSLEGLRQTANYRASFRFGLVAGILLAGVSWITKGRIPWKRIPQRNDRTCLNEIHSAPQENELDHGNLDLGIESDIYLSNLKTQKTEHIKIRDNKKCSECLSKYSSPCLRFCPAIVYGRNEDGSISICSENCLQCRCCTLKCPFDNIEWKTPENGSGPSYKRM